MTRRTMLYLGALVVVAGGAVAVQVASGADAPTETIAAPVAAHALPHPAVAHATITHPAAPSETPHVASHAAAPAPARPHAVHATPPAPAVTDTVVVERESFGYSGGGRRDPFRSLMATAALRPLPSELRLVAVAYDPTGVGSVAILRDATTHAQHRVGVGERVGRMRVVRIRPRTVVFAVEELGFSRTEVVTLSDSSATKQP